MSTEGRRLLHLTMGLIEATASGQAQWEKSDLPETYVLSTQSGTVTVSGPKSTELLGMGGVGGGYAIRVSDAAGNEVDSVATHSLALASAAGVGFMLDRIGVEELQELDALLRRLVDLIPLAHGHASDVADGILRELGTHN